MGTADLDEMDLTVNGTAERLQAGTVADLLTAKGLGEGMKGIAVAVNGTVVPRRAWAETALSPGDSVEIIQARQGG